MISLCRSNRPMHLISSVPSRAISRTHAQRRLSQSEQAKSAA